MLAQLSKESGLQTQAADEVHCTLWYKPEPGPDPDYNEGEAAAAVTLTEEQKLLYRGRNPPHLSLRKLTTSQWKDLGEVVRKGLQGKWENG